MGGSTFQLVQANVALGKAPLSEPVMQGFVEQLEYINSVADRSPGFVWRLQTEDGDATSVQVFDDPLVILNMSVWETIEDLYDYVFRSDHRGPMKNRRAWFDRMDRPHSVMWWTPAGERPTVAEAEKRLNLLRDRGPTPAAFTFATLFDPHGAPMARSTGRDRGCGV